MSKNIAIALGLLIASSATATYAAQSDVNANANVDTSGANVTVSADVQGNTQTKPPAAWVPQPKPPTSRLTKSKTKPSKPLRTAKACWNRPATQSATPHPRWAAP